MASEAEIKRRIALLREEAEINRGIFERDKRRTKALAASREAVEQILRLEAQLTDEYQDIDKTLESIIKKQVLSKNSTKDIFGLQRSVRNETKEQLNDVKGLLESGKLSESQSKKLNSLAIKLNDASMNLKDIKSEQYDLDKLIADETDETVKSTLEGFKSTLGAEEKRLEINDALKESASEFDGLLGGLGGKIKKIITNPIFAAVAALLAFNSTQESIGQQFGAIGVKEFRQELAGANATFARLGLSADQAQSTISTLSNEFGVSVTESAKLTGNIGRLAISSGQTVEDTTKLVGLFTQTQNLTGQQAVNLLQSAQFLATANDVAPDKVLADVAQNTEFFAQFADDGGKNILRAAVQARKLGINLQTVEKITTGLLDFQTSLNSEIEASVLIGRQLNFQKARELALANDIEGATAAVVEQLGNSEEFNRLNAIQRKALADAAGLEVSELTKIVNKEKEALTLQGALSKTEIKPIPEEVLTATASLINNLQSIGIVLAESLGPPLNFVVGLFGGLIEGIDKTIGMGPALLGLFTAIKAKALLSAAALVYNAVAGFFGAAAVGAPATLGFGTLALIGIATAATASMFGFLNSIPRFQSIENTSNVADITKGIGIADANESIVDTTRLNAALSGGGGVDTTKLEEKQNKTNEKLERVAAVLEGALSGPKPALARAMGSAASDSLMNNIK